MVTVPRQVPLRNDVWPDGPVGVLSRPQPASVAATRNASTHFARLVMRLLLPEPLALGTTVRRQTDRSADRNPVRARHPSPLGASPVELGGPPDESRVLSLRECFDAANRRSQSAHSARVW